MLTHICALFSFIGPPIGAKYSSDLSFSILGSQHVQLKILSFNRAQLTLHGIINSDDEVRFKYLSKGLLDFELTDNLQRILKRFLVKVSDARYEPDFAEIRIFVKPLRFRKTVVLLRELDDTTWWNFLQGKKIK
jgi:hypothetical protein